MYNALQVQCRGLFNKSLFNFQFCNQWFNGYQLLQMSMLINVTWNLCDFIIFNSPFIVFNVIKKIKFENFFQNINCSLLIHSLFYNQPFTTFTLR